MIWWGVFAAGILNFLTKFLSLTYLDSSKMSPNIRKVLSYVPSAVFPAIIFPSIFFDELGYLDLDSNPKILASMLALLVGYFSKNILITIFAGLISYWFLIFVYYQ